MIALAQGLHLAGHTVTLAASRVDANDASPSDYEALAPRLGFELRRVGGLHYTYEEHRRVVRGIQTTTDVGRQIELMLKGLFDPMEEAMVDAASDLCRDNEIVVGQYLTYPLTVAAAKMKRPYVSVTLVPALIPSAHAPPGVLPNLGRWLNPLAWRIAGHILGPPFLSRVNALRQRTGVPPATSFWNDVASSPLLNLVAASSTLVRPMPDWPAHHQVSGFLDVPSAEDHTIPEDLERFLAIGAPPVFMTLGSMLAGDVEFERITGILVAATKLAGCRAIIQAPWDEMHSIPESPDVHRVTRLPHAAIFRRCAAVVHHGGAGTSHSATLAGCPSIVVPYAYDQGYWAQSLKAAGVALAPLPRRTLRAEDLGRRVCETLATPGLKARAQALAEAMRKEDGVAQAVKRIEEVS